jgi:hypothetical protein
MIHEADEKVARLRTRREQTHIELRALHAKIATVLAETGPLVAPAASPAAEPSGPEQPADERPATTQPAKPRPRPNQRA